MTSDAIGRADRRALCYIFTLLLCFLGVVITTTRWTDIKGSFIHLERLATTSGAIVSSSAEQRAGNKSLVWHYLIRYRFQVAGKTFESDKVTFSITGFHDAQEAYAYVDRYPVGKRVVVLYEKSNPSFSVLEPHVTEPSLIIGPLLIVLPSLVFAYLVVSGFVAFWRSPSK